MSADVDSKCNMTKGRALNDTLQILFGVLVTVICLFIVSATRPREEMTAKELKKDDEQKLVTTDPTGQQQVDNEGKPVNDKRTEQEAMADANAAVYGKAVQKNTVDDDDEELAAHKKMGEEHVFPISDTSIQF